MWLITIAVVLGFLTRGLYKAWPFISRAVSTINALAELPGFIGETKTTLAAIKHEVLPNNGGSLRDAVDKHGVTLSELNGKVINDNTRLDALELAIKEKP